MSEMKNMNYNLLTGSVKVSGEALGAASDNIIKRSAVIEDSLMRFIACAENTTDIWQGASADEFRGRCSAYRSRVTELTSRISQSMDRLRKIAGIYEDAENRVAARGEELPSDAIS